MAKTTETELPAHQPPAPNRAVRTILGKFNLPSIVLVQSVLLWWLGLVKPVRSADMDLYYRSSLHLWQEHVPYRDFPLEYPPLALLPFAVPQALGVNRQMDFNQYCGLFLLENVVATALLSFLITKLYSYWQGAGTRGTHPLLVFAALALLMSPVLLRRYDVFPTLLTTLALAALMARRPLWSGIALGAAVGAKLYPLVLIPIFGAYYLAGRQFRALGACLAGTLGAAVLSALPLLFLKPSVALSFLRYHQQRGLQIESIPAGLLLALRTLGKTTATVASSYGAYHLSSPLALDFLRGLLPLFLVLWLLLVLLCAGRFRQEVHETGQVSSASLIAYSLAALLLFVIVNKVFSPQYLIWVLPFLCLLPSRQRGLGAAICLMTILIFSVFYSRLLQMTPPLVIFLNLRNLAVVVLAVWLVASHLPDSVSRRRTRRSPRTAGHQAGETSAPTGT